MVSDTSEIGAMHCSRHTGLMKEIDRRVVMLKAPLSVPRARSEGSTLYPPLAASWLLSSLLTFSSFSCLLPATGSVDPPRRAR